jgi:hypothetical protein
MEKFSLTHKIGSAAAAALVLGGVIFFLNRTQANSDLPVSISTDIASRDAQRIDDLQQVRKALEFYFYECGYYPGTAHASHNPSTIRFVCSCLGLRRA